MSAKEEQLIQLLGLSARSMTRVNQLGQEMMWSKIIVNPNLLLRPYQSRIFN